MKKMKLPLVFFDGRIKGSPIALVVLLVLIGVVLFGALCFAAPDSYISFFRTVESVSVEEDRALLKFSGDSVDYVFYEEEDSSFDVLEPLTAGTEVLLTVREDYQQPRYAIVYRMHVGDELLYSSVEEYEAQDVDTAVIGILSLVSGLIVWCVLLFFSMSGGTPLQFVSRSPDWMLRFIGCVTGFGAGGVFAVLLLVAIGRWTVEDLVVCTLFALFLLMGAVGLRLLFAEKAVLCDGVYTYYHPFRKPRSIAAENILCIHILPTDVIVVATDRSRVKIPKEFLSGDNAKNSFAYYKIPYAVPFVAGSVRETKADLLRIPETGRLLKFRFRLDGEEYAIFFSAGEWCLSRFGKDPKSVTAPDLEILFEQETIDGLVLSSRWDEIRESAELWDYSHVGEDVF